MRAAIIAAAFAASAFAAPYSKRAMVVDYQIDVVTKLVTVTAGQPAPTQPAVANFIADTTAPAPTPEVTVDNSDDQTSTQSSSDDSSTPAPPPPAADQSSSDSASSGPASGSYQDAVLYHHNVHRANHSAPDLSWNQDLADIAATIGQSCYFGHKMYVCGVTNNVRAYANISHRGVNGATYGQNIASGPAPEDVGKVISNMFYNNELPAFDGLYGIADPSDDNFAAWGHFSQLVWKDTSSVGCATIDCSGPGLTEGGGASWFTVCNYAKPGKRE